MNGNRGIFWTIVSGFVAVGVLLISLVSPLRTELSEHERMPAHVATATQMRAITRELDATRADMHDLRVEIRELRKELALQ